VLFVLVAPVLIGMIGLIVDGGIVMAAQRQTQNAADAAAVAAAMDLYRGASNSTALATAQTFVANNGLSATLTLNGGASNALNIPPKDPGNTGSPYKNQANYVEAIVSQSVNTLFIQILGINSTQTVSARAVAGYEAVGAGEGVMVLDPTVSTGVTAISNNVQLIVKGDITINANGQGLDQYGQPVGTGTAGPSLLTASATRSIPTIIAQTVFTVGGTNNLGNIATYDPAYPGFYNPSNPNPSGVPLFAPAAIAPDPLINLATPMTSNGVTPKYYSYSGTTQKFSPAPSATSVTFNNGDTVTLPLGIYSDITISTGATVTLTQGITVIAGSSGLTMHGGTLKDNGAGVMIYNTAGSYNLNNGTPDSTDGGTKPTTTVGGGVTIDGGSTINLSPLTNNTTFNGMVFYQRRGDNSPLIVTGNSSNINFSGAAGQISTLYAKWAGFTLAGTGKYDAQFLVGNLTINGGAAVTIDATGKSKGRGNLVFLVE
jgi:Flp pilus assembly protein TadG